MDINKDFKNGTYGIVSDKSIFINDDKYPHKLATIEDLKTQAAILERYITFNMSTGAITFDGVSGSVGATTYVVGAGKGYIIDNFTDVANPTLTYVE